MRTVSPLYWCLSSQSERIVAGHVSIGDRTKTGLPYTRPITGHFRNLAGRIRFLSSSLEQKQYARQNCMTVQIHVVSFFITHLQRSSFQQLFHIFSLKMGNVISIKLCPWQYLGLYIEKGDTRQQRPLLCAICNDFKGSLTS